jgi:tryptophan 2,3-dioxygenase
MAHPAAPEHTPEEWLRALQDKYAAIGQNPSVYLEGLLYAKPLHYWDYIHVDTLLSLQMPRTDFPDEQIFIMYHQVTELYFKMVQLEMEQIQNQGDAIEEAFLVARVDRINRYFQILVQSFDVMLVGMDAAQFRKFRMSLFPASGFQSAQFRMIEIRSAPLYRLLDQEAQRELRPDTPLEVLYEQIHWKKGAIDQHTGHKTLTLQLFEEKYDAILLQLARDCRGNNLGVIVEGLLARTTPGEVLTKALRQFDLLINVHWPLAHFRSAMHYLHRHPEPIAATGNTNWQQYLPPFFQKRIFFPQLWSEAEKADWGRDWVEENLLKKR